MTGAVVGWLNRQPPEPLHQDNFQGQPYLFPVFAGVVAVTLVGLSQARLLGRLIDNRFARYTARISFGICIWHYLILEGVAQATRREFVCYGIADPWRHALLSAVVLVLTFAAASASWRWIERPALVSRWASRRLPAEAPAGAGAPALVSPGD